MRRLLFFIMCIVYFTKVSRVFLVPPIANRRKSMSCRKRKQQFLKKLHLLGMRLVITIPFFILLCLYSTRLAGQKYEYPRWALGVTPSALGNLNPGLQLSFDRRLSRKVNFDLESAYIFFSPFKARGFRIRPGVEFLLASGEKTGFTLGVYYNYRWTSESRIARTVHPSGEFTRIDWNHRRIRQYMGPLILLKFLQNSRGRWTYNFAFGGGLADYRIFEENPLDPSTRLDSNNDFFILDRSIGFFVLANFHLNVSYTIR